MSAVAGALLGDALFGAIGAGFLLAIGWWERLAPLSRIGPAVFCGIACGAVALPLLVYADVAPTPIVGGALATIALAAGLALHRRRTPAERGASGGGLWAALAVGGLLVPFTVRALVEPVVKFDAYADWQLKARLLYGHGGLVLGALNPHALGASYLPGHREYPLGFPATTALVFHTAGGASARVAHVQALVLFLGFAATAWALLRPHVSPLYLGCALCLVASASSLHYQVLSTYADVPLAAAWSLAACALAIWLARGDRCWLVLAATLAAAALAIKQEGIPLDVSLFGVAAVGVLADDRRRIGALVAAGLAAFATALPWRLEVRAHHLHDPDIDPSLARMGRQTGTLPTIVHRVAAELLGVRWPGILPLALIVAVVLVAARRDRLAFAYLALLAVSCAALVTIYWNARIAVGPLLTESAERVVTAPVFLSVLALPFLFERLSPSPARRRADALPRATDLRDEPSAALRPVA